MNKQIKTILIIIASIIVGIGAVAYGALTAPKQTIQPSPTPTITVPTKSELEAKLKTEQATINTAIIAAYPKIATDYTISQGQLFDQGQWYGTTLTYKGSDAMSRDTLRVLLQKKQGVWTVRSTPPEPLLSAIKYPDVPKKVLQTINKAISLPGTDSSPPVNAAE